MIGGSAANRREKRYSLWDVYSLFMNPNIALSVRNFECQGAQSFSGTGSHARGSRQSELAAWKPPLLLSLGSNLLTSLISYDKTPMKDIGLDLLMPACRLIIDRLDSRTRKTGSADAASAFRGGQLTVC